MSITISGDNQTITSTAIVGSTSGLITRNGLTTNSTDTFDTAENIILAYYGVNDGNYNGDSFNVRIYNDSNFTITLSSGTGITQLPASTDIILPKTVRNYIFTKVAASTANIYLVSSGTGNGSSSIPLTNGQILVGNENGIASDVAISGDASVANTGVLTLANTGVTATSYTLTNLTVDSKGRITTASNTTPQPLTKTDDTNVTLTLGGTPATALLEPTSITLGWSGQLSGSRGGTGVDNGTNTITIGGNFLTTDQISIGSTATANQLLYTSSPNNISGITSVNSAVLVTSSTGVPEYTTSLTSGQVIIGSSGSTPVPATLTAGAGISITNGAGSITITSTTSGGTVTSVSGTTDRITISGDPNVNPTVDIASTYVGQTSITTLGTILTGTWNGGVISPTYGGTGLSTVNSSAVLVSNNLGVPEWSTSLANGQIIIGSTGNTPVSASLTAGAGISITPGPGSITIAATGGGVNSVSGTTNRITVSGTASDPVIDISSTYVGQTSITTLGTISTGTWNGGVISPTYGGTGVNNGSNTITLGGNFTTSGSFTTTLTVTGNTNVTLPTSGTLLNNTLLDGNIYVGNVSNVATGVAMSGDATIANTGALTLANTGVTAASYGGTTTVGTFTVDAKGRLTVATDTEIQDASAAQKGLVNTGAQTFAGDKTFTGSVRSNTSLVLEDPGAGTNTVTIQSGVPTTSYTLTLPVDDGTNGQVLTTDGTGVLSWTTGGGGGGITSINGETGAAQTITTGTAGTDVNTAVTTDTTTINIPTASGTNTGKLSNTDWTTFNNKLSTTLTSANIFVGNAGNIATGVPMTGDVSITNTGTTTVGAINGATLGTTTATDANVLIANGTQWVTQPISQDVSITNTGVATVTGLNGTPISAGGGEVLAGMAVITEINYGDFGIGAVLTGAQYVSTAIYGTAISQNSSLLLPTAVDIAAQITSLELGLTFRTFITNLSSNRSLPIRNTNDSTNVFFRAINPNELILGSNNNPGFIALFTVCIQVSPPRFAIYPA